MSILPFLSLAGALRSQAKAFVDQQPAAWPRPRGQVRLASVAVTVAGRDALLVRRAVLGCPGAAVVSCLPMHREDKVKLEIRFPAGQSDAVIGRLLACLPHGEIGGVVACASLRPKVRHAGSNMGHPRGH